MIDLSVKHWTGLSAFYEATSVLDFINDKEGKRIKGGKWKFWRSSIDGLAHIRFANVNLYFKDDYLLKDSTGEIDLKKLGFENAIFNRLFLPLRKRLRPNLSIVLEEEGHHYEVDIDYNVINDVAYLKTVRKFDLENTEPSPSKYFDWEVV